MGGAEPLVLADVGVQVMGGGVIALLADDLHHVAMFLHVMVGAMTCRLLTTVVVDTHLLDMVHPDIDVVDENHLVLLEFEL